MKHFTAIITLVAAIVLFAGQSIAQGFIKQFRLENPHSHSVKVPFQLINNLIIIPLQINNSEELYFILDSGVKTAILTELPTNDSLRFTYGKIQLLQGLGESKAIEAFPSYGNTIHIEGIVGENQDVYVLGANDLALSARLGTRVNGLIGYDLLKDFVVEVNYQYHYLVFHDPVYYHQRTTRRSFSLPVEISESRPFLTTQIGLEDGLLMDVRLLVDMGGGFALWLSTGSDSLIKVPSPSHRTYLGYGMNGEISGYIGRIQYLQLGPDRFNNPIVAYPDSGAVVNMVLQDNRHGSLGAEVLRRYNLIIDYPGQNVTFTPNNNFHSDFTYNRSGIEVTAPIPGVRIYFVSRVESGSMAEVAGVRVDDQILSINLSLASECSINDINAHFHGRSGQLLKLKLMRKGHIYKVRVPLADPF